MAGPQHLLLEEAYLSSFGHMRLPQHLYTALQRFDAWIEPALLAEWARLIKGYSLRQHRAVDENTLVAALAWSDPARDVGLARGQALRLLESGGLQCVYSGRRLTANSLDIDHCLPWHAWPRGYHINDLWNLLPASSQLNRQKSDRVPSEVMLSGA